MLHLSVRCASSTQRSAVSVIDSISIALNSYIPKYTYSHDILGPFGHSGFFANGVVRGLFNKSLFTFHISIFCAAVCTVSDAKRLRVAARDYHAAFREHR